VKNKKAGADPEIMPVGFNIRCREPGDQPKHRCAVKIHGNSEQQSNEQVHEPEKIQESSSRFIPFIGTDAHGFGDEYRYIDIVDKTREKDHGSKYKKVDIGFDIGAKIPGNDDGEQEEDAL